MGRSIERWRARRDRLARRERTRARRRLCARARHAFAGLHDRLEHALHAGGRDRHQCECIRRPQASRASGGSGRASRTRCARCARWAWLTPARLACGPRVDRSRAAARGKLARHRTYAHARAAARRRAALRGRCDRRRAAFERELAGQRHRRMRGGHLARRIAQAVARGDAGRVSRRIRLLVHGL